MSSWVYQVIGRHIRGNAAKEGRSDRLGPYRAEWGDSASIGKSATPTSLCKHQVPGIRSEETGFAGTCTELAFWHPGSPAPGVNALASAASLRQPAQSI